MKDALAIRPYEMSVWTLRDRYLATLKIPGIENKGHIENPTMTLNVDGTQELKFEVPMYYSIAGKLVENPRWYDVKHGLLMQGLRKIKVIFTDENEVFEFLVVNIDEKHDTNGSLYCSVEASGLAFQELGKKGYKISLSPDDYLNDCLEFYEKIEQDAKIYNWTAEEFSKQQEKVPINNINYWCDKVFANSDWYYTIQMDWGNYDGYIYEKIDDPTAPYIGIGKIDKMELGKELSTNAKREYISFMDLTPEEQIEVNNLREALGLRRNDKIYEDDFVTSWEPDEENNTLIPKEYEKRREKYRQVEASESNMYNITQTLAETFGVYCKYKFHYDENFHIIGKEVIFHNNFTDELHGVVDLTYPYNTTSITRTMDSNDLCTKLIVPYIEDSNVESGILSITNTSANRSGEDYLFDFDYLYETGSIDEDQYNEVKKYELDMKKNNVELANLSKEIIAKENEKIDLEATKTISEVGMAQALDVISQARSGLNALTDNEAGTIEGYTTVAIKQAETDGDNTTYYINLTDKGIVNNSNFKLYKTSSGAGNLDDEIANTDFTINMDVNGNINKVILQNLTEIEKSSYMPIYVQCDLRPQLYYENIINTYAKKWEVDNIAKTEAEKDLEKLENELMQLQKKYDDTLNKKNERIADFEKMMGPALREGNWRPEDYQDYGDKYSKVITVPEDLIWDDEPFDGEDLGYYEEGINQDKVYYPCIDISGLLGIINESLEENKEKGVTVNDLCFKYEEYYAPTFAYTEDTGSYSYTLADGTSFSGESLSELEKKVLKYGIKLALNSDEEIEVENQPSNLILAIRRKYGLSYSINHYFKIGSTMHFGFLKDKDNNIIPVLVLNDIQNVYVPNNKTLQQVLENGAELCFVDYQVIVPTEKVEGEENRTSNHPLSETVEFSDYTKTAVDEKIITIYPTENNDLSFIYDYGTKEYTYVYPRYQIESLSLKTSSDQFSITLIENDEAVAAEEAILDNYEDYNLLIRDDSYFITFSPEPLIKYGSFENKKFKIDYVLSNAELNIYLDAREVLKSNSRPQVSYEIDVSLVNEYFIKYAYKQLNRVVHINDHELKFENVMGYVSNLELDLDHPWEDSIEIKNYKTKFEDLFTKIVASTEAMKANEGIYNKAASAFTSTGIIKPDIVQSSLESANFSLTLNKGNLTIDSVEGIQAISDEGIVMMTGGGIYCANEQDASGNWKWHTGISPKGINASLITTGQLDTNAIRIFAGDKTAFQMNKDGLFAYRVSDGQVTTNEKEYVVHNGEGLFLVNKDVEIGAETKDVNRVEVSWDGLIIRNLSDEKVFYADNDGNLKITGTITANDGDIGGWLIKENALIQTPTSNANRFTGMASGPFIDENNKTNILDSRTGLYKVFWVGERTDPNYFYVDSTGVLNATSVMVNNSLVASKIVLDGILLNDVIKEVRENTGSINVVNLTSDTFNNEETLRFALISNSTIDLTDGGSLTFYYLSRTEEEQEEEFEPVDGDTNEQGGNDEVIESDESEESEENLMINENWIFLPPNDEDEGYSYYSIEDGIESHYLTFSIYRDIISLIPGDSSTITLKAAYNEYEAIFTIYISEGVGAENLLVHIIPMEDNSNGQLTLKALIHKNGILIDENIEEYTYQWGYINEEGNSVELQNENNSTLIINSKSDILGTYFCTVREVE